MSSPYDIRFAIDPVSAAAMNTRELRDNFLVDNLFGEGRITWAYTHYDRMAIGGAVPGDAPLALETILPVGSPRFLDRREMIAINIGGAGAITADGTRFEVGNRDMLYLGMGTQRVAFEAASTESPAKFYLISAPAHAAYPTRMIRIGDAKRVDLGSRETSNERSIFQFIHPDSAKTCQLVVGMTTLAPGSVWNTMPAHFHDRRMEAHLYFGLDPDALVVHLMGEPGETRHIITRNEEAVLSPPWSIHAGAATSGYTFIWAMAGDNVDYTDVDKVEMGALL